ncbi:hypothetical protein F4821DRAFT_264823 [Hypoxylon rubiginosum]|uniref:Uncharacterized protein n=1 Tax=Hypoxylon rubiginosum TaxID=110542 RepID=A0ACC0CM77_9PEZI|nr:hypothetical protein F4821DRAFT_264823 [Hypoxylon rubiginosum]
MAQSPSNAERDLSMVGGNRDIAKTISLERMEVQAKGRQPFQQVYLWTPSINEEGSGGNPLKRKRATTLRYDPNSDGPKSMPCPPLPGDEELLPHDDAKLYLEVGLIIGDEPDRYKPTGLARSKSRQEAM